MTASTRPSHAGTTGRTNVAYSVLIGITTLLILLQALWAGLFIHEGKDYSQKWVSIHAHGADAAIVLAAVAAVVGFVTRRARRDLWLGALSLAVVLVIEAYIGGVIGDSPWVTAIHFPLAMAIMGFAVWLPLRARRAA